MKRFKYLAALFVGTLIYVIISMTCGQNSFWAANQLTEQKRVISANTARIQSINDELNLEKTAICNDTNVIAAYARNLDYVLPGEKLVKIKGLGTTRSYLYDTGAVLKSTKVLYVPEWLCKICGIVVTSLMFVVFFLYDVSYGTGSVQRRTFETVEGIPLYDLPQV